MTCDGQLLPFTKRLLSIVLPYLMDIIIVILTMVNLGIVVSKEADKSTKVQRQLKCR